MTFRRPFARRALLLGGLLAVAGLGLSAAARAQGPAPADQVRTALAELNRYLGTGPNAEGWKKYVRASELTAQLERGDQADWNVVSAAADQLNSKMPGLERPPFQKLRQAVAAWAAQLPAPAAGDLPVIARETGKNVTPITQAEVRHARQEVQTAATQLDRMLARSPRNAPGWKAYLQWNDLQSLLSAPEPDQEKLRAILGRLRGDAPGLEAPEFVRLGNALEVYGDLAEARGNAKFLEQLEQEFETVAQGLEKLAQGPDAATAEEVGLRLGYLARLSRGGPLVAAVRRVYSKPNLLIQASEPLVAAGIDADVSERAPVTDVINGTRISGTGDTRGRITLQLRPNAKQAWMEMLFGGQTLTSTVGVNGPATIRSSGVTNFNARKLLSLDERGFKAGPATAAATMSSQITGIGAGGGGGIRGRITQQTVRERVYSGKPQSDAIARQHAEDRVRERFDNRVKSQLAQSNESFQKKFRQPLEQEQAYPRKIDFHTSDKSLFVAAVEANDEQLGTRSAAPELPQGLDLSTVVHETTINNMAAAMLAGERRTQAEMEKELTEMFGKLPKKMQERKGDDPEWTITFAQQRPFTVDIEDGGLATITLRGDKFEGGDNDLPAFNITAKYKLERDGEVLKAVRQGDLEVVPPDFTPGEGNRLTSGQAAAANTLRKRFDKVFEPEIVTDPLILPGKWRKAGIMGLEMVDTAGDWVRLGWNRTGRPAPPEEPETTARRP
ncbi:MAG: hypothetical protein U0836_24730 [Pirellulales bacterium]